MKVVPQAANGRPKDVPGLKNLAQKILGLAVWPVEPLCPALLALFNHQITWGLGGSLGLMAIGFRVCREINIPLHPLFSFAGLFIAGMAMKAIADSARSPWDDSPNLWYGLLLGALASLIKL